MSTSLFELSRRKVLVSMISLPTLSTCFHQVPIKPDFDVLEARSGGRLGVAALDLASGGLLSHRGDERFAMCSAFKWLLGGLILHKVDLGEETLARQIPIQTKDLVFYSPVTEPLADAGSLSIGDLCAATIERSDNTAANMLLAVIGGPEGFTQQVRRFGDDVTRLDRLEPDLNENAQGDPRDTSSPVAMIGLMRAFLFGDVLSPESRQALRQWMISADTGLQRLRAGLPSDWTSGDKTGTSSNDQSNDVAFAIPPEIEVGKAGPVLIVSFINAPDPMAAKTNAIHADLAREVMKVFLR